MHHLACTFFFTNPSAIIDAPNVIAPNETFWALISELKKNSTTKSGPYTFIKNSGAVWSTYKTMKEQEERFGLEVRVRDMAEILLTQL